MDPLQLFLNPRGIAVVGASNRPGTVGYVIVDQLRKRFRGAIYPVNPKYDTVLGLKCYRSVLEVPDPVDLAVLAVRAELVPRIMEDVGRRGIRAAIVVSGGFAEIGPEGEARQRALEEVARRYGIRIIGPNCIGVLDNYSGVDTFFLPEERLKRPPRGYISIASQSGALLSMWIDWMAMKGMGLAKAVSYGNKIDIDEVDALNHFAEDPNTRVVLLYIESIKPGRGQEFIKAVRRVISRGKPVIALKGGRTRRGMAAAASNTAAMAASYEIYRAVFRQAGVVEVDEMEEMFDVAKAFVSCSIPKGNRVLIVTNAGGEGVLAADYAERYGLEVVEMPDEVKKILREKLPPHVAVGNPIDLAGDTDDERYRIVFETVLPRNLVDAVIVIAPPHPPALTGRIVDYVDDARRRFGIPMLAVVTGGVIAEEFAKKFEERGIATYPSPERAVKALAAMVKFGQALSKVKRP